MRNFHIQCSYLTHYKTLIICFQLYISLLYAVQFFLSFLLMFNMYNLEKIFFLLIMYHNVTLHLSNRAFRTKQLRGFSKTLTRNSFPSIANSLHGIKKCPYFKLFWSAYSRIQTRTTPKTGTFHAVPSCQISTIFILSIIFTHIWYILIYFDIIKKVNLDERKKKLHKFIKAYKDSKLISLSFDLSFRRMILTVSHWSQVNQIEPMTVFAILCT